MESSNAVHVFGNTLKYYNQKLNLIKSGKVTNN